MKKIFILLLFLSSLVGYSQVNINNNTVQIDATGNFNIPSDKYYTTGTDTISKYKLVHRYTIGTKGNFTTIASAVTWLENHMTAPTELLLDGGTHSVPDSIHVELPYTLVIRGISSNSSSIIAATGLNGKPFFSLYSDVTFLGVTIDGSTLANWGDAKPEDAIRSNTGCTHIELGDVVVTTARVGLRVLDSADIWVFNSIFENCSGEGVGIYNASTKQNCFYDIEINTFTDCTKGIEFADGDSIQFAIKNNLFQMMATDTALYFQSNAKIKRVGTLTTITGNDLSHTVNALIGLNFTLPINANVFITGNANLPNKTPEAKINVINNTATTTITAVNTFYKANLNNTVSIVFNAAATGGTFTITVGSQTTGAIAHNANSATMATNIKTAIDALSNVTAVTVTSVVAQKEFSILYTTANEGWETHSANVALLTSVSSYYFKANTYNTKFTVGSNRITYLPEYTRSLNIFISCNLICSNANRSSDIAIAQYSVAGVLKAIYGQMTGIILTTVTAISTNVYVPSVANGDYFEIVLSKSTNAGETLIISDLTWLTE